MPILSKIRFFKRYNKRKDDWQCEVLFRDDETVAAFIDTVITEDIPVGFTFSDITVQSQVVYSRKAYIGRMFDASSLVHAGKDNNSEEIFQQ